MNQVGFHNRFIGTFQEAARLVRAGALGKVSNIHGSAFGQVVIKEQNRTWRAKRVRGRRLPPRLRLPRHRPDELPGRPARAGPRARPCRPSSPRTWRTRSRRSSPTPGGASGILETNWSDETYRKMSTTVTVHGTKGKLVVDRQELKVYLREGAQLRGLRRGLEHALHHRGSRSRSASTCGVRSTRPRSRPSSRRSAAGNMAHENSLRHPPTRPTGWSTSSSRPAARRRPEDARPWPTSTASSSGTTSSSA